MQRLTAQWSLHGILVLTCRYRYLYKNFMTCTIKKSYSSSIICVDSALHMLVLYL
jgi:hypothetical protein